VGIPPKRREATLKYSKFGASMEVEPGRKFFSSFGSSCLNSPGPGSPDLLPLIRLEREREKKKGLTEL